MPQGFDRRAEDDRLARIEESLSALTGEVGKIRNRLGDRNTTLIFDLDQRYMPREELRKEYVPRVEQEQQKRFAKAGFRNWALVLFAGASWLTTIIELLTHHGHG